nr:type ISP restriction/modification enzyme [Exiguobacterium sp. Helios]
MDAPDRQQRDRGTMFELLSRTYFQNEPLYERLFEAVWTLNGVPEEYGIPKNDTGVDLVAKERETGALVAIQCKYHAVENTIQKSNIDSFLNEVGKTYYSWGIIVASTDKWSKNANDALEGRDKKITRISLSQLQDSQIDWSSFSYKSPETTATQPKKTPRNHQIPAITSVVNGFKSADRGKLIMAPGTGKTYTSMAIAEEMAKEKNGVFKVLYLVPSIQLLSQTLRGWTADTNCNMDAIAVCSDRKVTKKTVGNEFDDIAASDIGYPATTDYTKLLAYKELIESDKLKGDFLTVFSTYQSINVIVEAQKQGFYDFDLIVCDEAHRTTGVTENGEEDSSFKKVHSNDNVRADKRLYQTATPRIYGESAKEKANDVSALLADMSDETIYGEELYRIGFGEAVRKGILTDYKVMVLAVDEEMVARNFQQMLATDSELNFDDVTKIIGCWNGLVRRRSHSDEVLGPPMKRAIAFAGTIKESKLITDMFSNVVDQYLYQNNDEANLQYKVEIEHADGSMNALEKNKKISWLKGEVPNQTCRILSNARFLTEGVDVPELDAIMFLKPRKSKIDIAQAVGRVMRKSPGKDYGYVILPIGVPAGTDENNVLDNNEKYKVVWEVLNALRSLDERFDATINKLDLNKSRSKHVQIIGVGEAPEDGELKPLKESQQLAIEFDAEELSNLEKAIYGKIVRKVGNVRYWEDWSKDVSEIARKHVMRISVLLEDHQSIYYKEFKRFVTSLRHNINDSISEEQAIQMLSQHLITKPVFEALFDSYSFVNDNPVSRSMEAVLKILDENQLEKEQKTLEPFYESVRIRAQGIDNLKGKQDIIVQLYDKFFKIGFEETTKSLGIVFTPVEVVDFIINSVNHALEKHLGKSIFEENIHLLDPFTGTGTFITRLLQSGLIPKEHLLRKYMKELHANEIVLLSYYIAAINIEETFHSLISSDSSNESNYKQFEGIVLTDTFDSTERDNSFEDPFFSGNDVRLKRQKEQQITVILGNPPYSIGQTSANDNNQNVEYPSLNKRIDDTYAKYTTGLNKKSLFDSYIKAFRWASDKIGQQGIIAFITPNSIIDKPSHEGFRKVINEEFNYVYSINLKGAVRGKIGEEAKKEGQSVFNILTGVAITILVKDNSENHKIYYHDIGDYLSRNEKLAKLESLKSIQEINFVEIDPDSNNDWINQRDQSYATFDNMDSEVFLTKAIGVTTNRDSWVYNFSNSEVAKNSSQMINNFNHEIDRLATIDSLKERAKLVNTDETYIKWSRGLKHKFDRSQRIDYNSNAIIESYYRPFTKKWLYYDKSIVEYPGIYHSVFGKENKIIYVSGGGARRDFSALVVDKIPNLHLMENGRGYLLYNNDTSSLFTDNNNINESFSRKINLSPEDVFYYVYGVLHSKEFCLKYNNDLRKASPRIPILKNKEEFVRIGKALVEIHLNFEKYPSTSLVDVIFNSSNPSYEVKKIKFLKNKKRDTIIFNQDITIANIPIEAHEYIVNGRSAIEWIINQYQLKANDDPNEYSTDEKYIYNLLLSVINVSIQTVNLINSLPPLELE